MADAVDRRVAQVDVGRRHVDPCPQNMAAVGKFAGTHPPEDVEILVDAAIPIRAVLAGLGQGAAIGPHLVGRQRIDIGLAAADQVLGELVHPREIVGREELIVAPVESQPPDCIDDRVHVLLLFLGRIGVVEAKVAGPAELFGQTEIEADRLRMAEVQIPVGLRREPRAHRLVVGARPVAPAVEVGFDRGTQKIRGCGGFFGRKGHDARLLRRLLCCQKRKF